MTAATQATASANTASGAPSAAPTIATSFASPQPMPLPRENSAAPAKGTNTMTADATSSHWRCAIAKSSSAASGASVKTSGTMPQIVSLHQQATSANTTIAA